MTIPQVFSRTKLCERCLANQLPYQTTESLKRKELKFFVVTHDQESPLRLRKQTKAAQPGFTPHIFMVENTDQITEQGERLYKLYYACGVVGCGTSFEIIGGGIIDVHFEITIDPKLKTQDELLYLYHFKDASFMLDNREEQFEMTSELLTVYFPN